MSEAAEPFAILLVEDNARHAGLMREELESNLPAASVTLTQTVAEARAALRDRTFEVCILDYQLPDGEGLEILRAIREAERSEAVIVVTTSTSPEVAVEAMKIGAEDYIVKGEGYVSILPFVIRQVVERMRLRAERTSLERRLARAEHLASLNTLMAGIAHNLNNPLTTVRTFLELLPERYDRDPEFRTSYYDLVLSELQRIRALIHSMRQAVALPLTSEEAPWRMADLLCELEIYVRGSASGKQVAFASAVDEDLPLLAAGREAVKQALVILLDNAVAFSPERGRVELRGRRLREGPGPARIRVEVADQGPGVPPENREKIFDPFFSTRPGGLGIGLFVAHAVARVHGGSLEVATGEAGGAVFSLTLPAEGAERNRS